MCWHVQFLRFVWFRWKCWYDLNDKKCCHERKEGASSSFVNAEGAVRDSWNHMFRTFNHLETHCSGLPQNPNDKLVALKAAVD